MKFLVLSFCIFLFGSLLVARADTATNLINGHLVILQDGSLQPVDDSALDKIEYFALYYAAKWCPSCHTFTPKLVRFYNDYKPSHSNFELVFISEDNDSNAMLSYVKEMAMPWPVFKYNNLMHNGFGTFKAPGIESFGSDGIPDLVLVDASGKVLSDSYRNGKYAGPSMVIEDIKRMVH